MAKKPEEQVDTHRFTRRAVVLGALQVGAFGLLTSRLYQLQVVDAAQYTTLAEENRINYQLVAPPRGYIYDRFGHVVASNRDNLKIIIVPEDAGDLDALLERLHLIAPLETKERDTLLRRARRQRAFVPLTVKEHLTWAQFARLNVKGPDFPGVRPEAGHSRLYHYGPELAHVIGYVGPVNDWEAASDPSLMIPGLEIGRNGVEEAYNKDLKGKAGIRHVEVNAGGRVIRELKNTPTTSGSDLVLSVDLELQKFATERLAGEQAAVVVMDVNTGEVYAMASTPGFDTNEFVGGMSSDTWRKLQRDPMKPLLNRAVRGQYPPGSTFKMVVALAALESGLVKPHQRVRCPGVFSLGRVSFRCWKRGGHGPVNMHDAIKRSCDVFFYDRARKIGIERIAAMARKLGLGSAGDIDYNGAKPGLIPTPGWKQSTLGEPWYPGETVVAGIGQGYVLSTPMQLAVYAARLASGRQVEPRLVRAVGAESVLEKEFDKLDIDEGHLALIRKAMNAVVNEPGGTAGRSKFDVDGMLMAGKTGTSQVVSLKRVRKVNGKIAREHMDHALFVAYTPTDAPKYAAAVIVEHGGGGSRAAAPVAKDILMKAHELNCAGKPAFVLEAPQGQTAQEEPGTKDG